MVQPASKLEEGKEVEFAVLGSLGQPALQALAVRELLLLLWLISSLFFSGLAGDHRPVREGQHLLG